MFKFDRKKFFEAYRSRFGPLTQNLVDALEFILAQIENDARFGETETDRRQLAYCLGTFKWETAHTLRPIDESERLRVSTGSMVHKQRWARFSATLKKAMALCSMAAATSKLPVVETTPRQKPHGR
ncbi:MAG TPA: hypothetical protein VJ372_05190 [Pyrinomonadaceae bacterium]|jgi:hypothetical protein|nr:hypothetical protein [Pyrinomonadaceae bacterium]